MHTAEILPAAAMTAAGLSAEQQNYLTRRYALFREIMSLSDRINLEQCGSRDRVVLEILEQDLAEAIEADERLKRRWELRASRPGLIHTLLLGGPAAGNA